MAPWKFMAPLLAVMCGPQTANPIALTEGGAWGVCRGRHDHTLGPAGGEAYSLGNGIHMNGAESYFSRLRRMIRGQPFSPIAQTHTPLRFSTMRTILRRAA